MKKFLATAVQKDEEGWRMLSCVPKQPQQKEEGTSFW